MTKKHIIITKLFEFSGSNTHLKTLVKFLGPGNVILILEDSNQLQYLKNIDDTNHLDYKVKSNLYAYAHLRYKWTTNIKELFFMLKSILAIQLLSIKYNFADVTICAVEPEKHLYFLWIPLSKVYYILHTTPNKQYTSFTSYTCNSKLSNRKMIITVSHSNKSLISGNWEISKEKQQFIRVIYNCILEQEEPKQDKTVIHKENKIYVITMGHVIAYKNPAIWLKVARSVIELRPNVSFLWLGNGPLIDTYQSAVQNHEKITFKGAVTNTYEYLKVADIYYQPSLYETHGIAVVEAMYKSLPCVVSNVGGLPESVQNGYNGYLVDPENLNQHVEVILNLIDTSDLRARYGGNSYNRYNQLFSFKHFTDQLSRIYN